MMEATPGFPYLPYQNSSNDILEGDVFLDTSYLNQDRYASHLIGHEIGHALGCTHPQDGFTNQYNLTNHQSIMSYDINFNLSSDPMPFDIKAMEFLYGGNPSANIQDNIYKWDYKLNFRTSIVDKKGKDLIDLSSNNNGVFVNLSPESWSSLSYSGNEAQFLNEENWTYEFGNYFTSSAGSIIEDVLGSRYNDFIIDNNDINEINSGRGNDDIYHNNNSDVINGGGGFDTIYLQNKNFSDINFISLGNNQSSYIIDFNDYQLTVENIEFLVDITGKTRMFSNVLYEKFNQAPTSITLDASDITENDFGGHIANISGFDPDGDNLIYSIVSSNNFLEIANAPL